MRRRSASYAAVIAALLVGPAAVVASERTGSASALATVQATPPSPTTGDGAGLPPGITPEARAAIDRGLTFLIRRQHRQGYWVNEQGLGEYPVAMTALATMALLMDGNTSTQGRYASQVDRAARYLISSARNTGLIAHGDGEGRPMYGHGFTMLVLGQLYGMTEDARRAREIHDVLSRAVTLTGRSQSRFGGWIYTPDAGADEGSVTITQVQGLRSCRNAGVAVPRRIIDDAMQYLVRSQNSDGGIRYSLTQGGSESRPAITAAAVCCWFNAGEYTNPRARSALAYAKRTITPRGVHGGHYYYAHLYLSQALYVARDPTWDGYFADLRDRLLTEQAADGSWNGDGAGEIYGTAAALIMLQLPFNQVPIMQR
jgi:hypothetical protein